MLRPPTPCCTLTTSLCRYTAGASPDTGGGTAREETLFHTRETLLLLGVTPLLLCVTSLLFGWVPLPRATSTAAGWRHALHVSALRPSGEPHLRTRRPLPRCPALCRPNRLKNRLLLGCDRGRVLAKTECGSLRV